ncbi:MULTISPECIES: hypothetical protein [unclassified Rhizobium]|uniref:hypothetical protein n=1 Tax=unclassified Rhizobium TaxID=2613769 RepID=UPI0025FC28A7|nr:hypothetical protein [Rhizobium sp. UBA1881]
MVDKVKVKRAAGTPNEREIEVSVGEFARSTVADPEWIPAATLTLTRKHQGRALIFSGPCVVTVPSGLPEGFSCGLMQAGAGVVTLAPGAGVTLNSMGGALTTAGQWAIVGLSALAPEMYIAYGSLVA